jgi:hypothetical protein
MPSDFRPRENHRQVGVAVAVSVRHPASSEAELLPRPQVYADFFHKTGLFNRYPVKVGAVLRLGGLAPSPPDRWRIRFSILESQHRQRSGGEGWGEGADKSAFVAPPHPNPPSMETHSK